jgi:hypothetical protein
MKEPLKLETCFWCGSQKPLDTWKFNQDRCPACNKERPALKEREAHMANQQKAPLKSAEQKQREIDDLERMLKK